MRHLPLAGLICLLAAGCETVGQGGLKNELISVDRAFSALSVSHGPSAAFFAYALPNTKFLSEKKQGPEAIQSMFENLPKGAVLSWTPEFADVSTLGELGYTWGRYDLSMPGKPVRHGTYVTVWKRQPDGGWKIALDGGSADH
jgi:hypothetical protein